MKTDAELQANVMHELEWDFRIDHTTIGVAVQHGIVTLTGTVDSWGQRIAAQQAAHRVSGVLDVANDLQVKLPGVGPRTDADLARAVRDSLEWNTFVPASRIRSTVSEGNITLEGEVQSLAQRDDAEKAIERLAGVRLISNHIAVKPPRSARADDVHDAVARALARRALRESARVKVHADQGIVTLSGRVHSWAERKAVIGAARGTAGVVSVRDELQLEP